MPQRREPDPVFVIARSGGLLHWYWGEAGWTKDIGEATRFHGRDGWCYAGALTLTDPFHRFECFLHCIDWSL